MHCCIADISQVLALISTFWMLRFNGCDGLKCYQCENERSNFMCISEANLVECEPGMDTCQTMVAYNEVSEKLSIIKTCTKNNSCELQVNATRYERPCDRSLSSWVCTTCCYEDGCNFDAATTAFYVTRQAQTVATALLVTFISKWILYDNR